MSDTNPKRKGQSEESLPGQAGKLEEPYQMQQEGPVNPCQEACDEILTRIKEGGLPVTINPALARRDFTDPQFIEIAQVSKFIKQSRINFNLYKGVMDDILNCGLGNLGVARKTLKDKCDDYVQDAGGKSTHLLTQEDKTLFRNGALFSTSKAYSILKYATEKFVHTFLGLDPGDIANPPIELLPYISLIEAKLRDVNCPEIQIEFRPLFAELIWSYWLEEGMLGLTMNAIARRFQNKASGMGKEPLGNLSLDPLRPLNNLIWGYIQDSIHRLTPARRAFEYEHEYGLSLFAGGGLKRKPAESRSYFIQAFHNLLNKCAIFYKEADNLLKVPDAFPVLNALREVHLLLAEGAGNLFGDLPITARSEMMLEQYILSRPEIREFLGGRIMVPYDEAWMDRVDSMKALQGWPGTSISYYRDLAVFGEVIILSIRWISWSQVNNRDLARDWALTFRDEVQRYIHCYYAVTGVDLSAQDVAGPSNEKALMPAYLIMRKAQRDMLMKRR